MKYIAVTDSALIYDIIVIIKQRSTRHVSVIRLTNRRLATTCLLFCCVS